MAYSEDHIALAAEYALGTLGVDERTQVETMMAVDEGFTAIVRAWEYRLGTLNQMVGSVEPRPLVWENIKAAIASAAVAPLVMPQAPKPPVEQAAPPATASVVAEPPAAGPPVVETSGVKSDAFEFFSTDPVEVEPAEVEPRAVEPGPFEPGAVESRPVEPGTTEPIASETAEAAPAPVESATVEPVPYQHVPEPPPPDEFPIHPVAAAADSNVVLLAGRVRRWRNVASVASAIAAALLVVAGLQVYQPNALPDSIRPKPRTRIVEIKTPPQPVSGQFVAVLQQGGNSPAFILTVDAATKNFTVRKVGATPEAGKSFELWLISDKLGQPRSLGVIGGSDFTARPVLSGYDAAIISDATYAVTVEQAGGSPDGKPHSTPIFAGKLIEAVPPAPPPPK